MGRTVSIRWVLQKLSRKNQVIYSYFETKSNPFSIFNKNIDGKKIKRANLSA